MNVVDTKPVTHDEAVDIILAEIDALARARCVHGIVMVRIQFLNLDTGPQEGELLIGDTELRNEAQQTMTHMLRVKADTGIFDPYQGEMSREGDGLYMEFESMGVYHQVFIVFQSGETDRDVPMEIMLHGLAALQRVLAGRPWVVAD